MDKRTELIGRMDFNGETWRALKEWITLSKETKVGLLINENTHDKSNQIRGSLSFANEILALEKAGTLFPAQ